MADTPLSRVSTKFQTIQTSLPILFARSYVWLRVSMKVFNLHVVGVTFVMLYFGFMPHKCPIRHQCQTEDSDNNHTDKHSNENHYFVCVLGFLGLRVCVLGLGA